jgi:hypothetical protein
MKNKQKRHQLRIRNILCALHGHGKYDEEFQEHINREEQNSKNELWNSLNYFVRCTELSDRQISDKIYSNWINKEN